MHDPADTHDLLTQTFPGDSAMAVQMRAHDWAATPLGPATSWPESLKIPLRMLLTARSEMWLGWGEDLAFFYNDAYTPTLGVKHPNALGRPVKVVWSEIYDAVKDRFDAVMREGQSTWDDSLLLFLERNGYPEETYHTFSYSPLMTEDHTVGGLICIVTEETKRVLGERQLKTVRALASSLLTARTRGDVLRAVHDALATNRLDFPFAALALYDGADATVDAMADPVTKIAWPFKAVLDTGKSRRCS